MRGRFALLLGGSWLLSASASIACEMTRTEAGKPSLGSHKPVLAEDAKLSSSFGMRFNSLLNELRMHTGVDWSALLGTPVIAAGDGSVVAAGRKGMYGNMILLDHGAGWQTLYAHLSAFDVKVGDCVKFGTVIGKLGQSGLTSGPALHFEVQKDGQPVDPISLSVNSLPANK